MEQYLNEVALALPEATVNIAKLRRALLNDGATLRVAVYGKFNHGKSTLLNELIGKDTFKTSDQRETTQVSSVVEQGIEWIDTPGLDAAVDGSDDRLTAQASLERADVLMFVHSVREGELDRYECAHLQALSASGRDCNNTLLVLTQVEQLETDELERTCAAIATQLAGLLRLDGFQVSAQRHASGKPALMERSGIGALRLRIDALRMERAQARKTEVQKYVAQLMAEIRRRDADRERRLVGCRKEYSARIAQLEQDASVLQRDVRRKMEEI